MNTQTAIFLVDLFVVLIFRYLIGTDEVAGFQLVKLFPSFFHFIEIVAGKETTIGEQRFIHRTQLVNP